MNALLPLKLSGDIELSGNMRRNYLVQFMATYPVIIREVIGTSRKDRIGK